MKWCVFKNILSEIHKKEKQKSVEHEILFLIINKTGQTNQFSCKKNNFLENAWILYENLDNIIRFDISINDERKNYTELLHRYIKPSIRSALRNMPIFNKNTIVSNWKNLSKEKKKILSEIISFQVKELI